ncbi:GAF domain-containing protein [Deinococcus sp. Arct2-2]|uniref:sensor histidine kinase n=1 Tax=Deinococcus sp. Arct2-2 TaxID=2568653 RepID=UPI0010A48953|nr:ATP-binding protein [Deinococcus sp. Arct2-2]THF70855.1 GAF domain-containing protein [Deinococcus sp. Arct2-2]
MSLPSSTPALLSLNERLQDVTHALSAATTVHGVFEVLLTSALEAVDAMTGAVLLVNAAGDRLELAQSRGYVPGVPTIWKDGPLDGTVPAGDALLQQKALFFEHQEALMAAYPDLEQRVGAPPPVATAVLPMFESWKSLGLIVLDFREPHHFTQEERFFLRTLSTQCGIALGRARLMADLQGQVEQRTQQLQQQKAEVESRNRALEAVAQLSRALRVEADRYTLIGRAQQSLSELLSPGVFTFFELEGEQWCLKAQVGQFQDPTVQRRMDAGLPQATPALRLPFESRQPLYQQADTLETETALESVQDVHAAATLPLLVDGVSVGCFRVALFVQRRWTPIDQMVLETILHGLGLAIDRAEQAKRLRAQRDALAAANEELEAFAYSVSHDLRTPVRHVTSFAQLLRRNLGDRLDEKSARYLGVMDQAAGRMTTLIDAILGLSRTSQQPLHLGIVDLGAIVASVRDVLEPEVVGRQVNWTVGPLPLVMADPGLLSQVMENLISNALKYTAPRDPAHLEIWAEESPYDWRMFVRDNGVGFDTRYTHKLFGVFQRLHRQEEFEGNGVGLANVRRVIMRHGGTVSAEGMLDQGATFSFTLPKA